MHTLKSAIQGFMEREPYELWVDSDPQTGHQSIGIRSVEEPPEAISLIIGDVLQNFRASLDLAWQLTIANGNTPPIPIPPGSEWRRIEFPVFLSENDFSKNGLREIWGVSDEIRDLISGVQPFTAGQEAAAQPLWVLQELTNIDKHRTLHLTAHFIKGVTGASEPLKAGQMEVLEMISTGIFKNEAVLMVVAFDPPQAELKFEAKATLDIAFDERSAPADGVPVFAELLTIGSWIFEFFERVQTLA